jgi:hypothetical protein
MMFDDEIFTDKFLRNQTYPTMYIANVTTQFALMMEPLHLYDPDLSTET